MILGLSLLVFLHVLSSLLGIGSVSVILLGSLGNQRLDGSNAFVLLVATTLTSLSGFTLPAHKILPSHILGVLSLTPGSTLA